MRVPHAINCEDTRLSMTCAMIAQGCGGISRPYGTGVIRAVGYPALKRRANLTASLRDAGRVKASVRWALGIVPAKKTRGDSKS